MKFPSLSLKNNKKQNERRINLGSPESPTQKDVKPYLDEFLMDKYVIDVPLLRALLVRGDYITNPDTKKSAEVYSRIWTSEGSPLIVDFEKWPVALRMRYNDDHSKGFKNSKTR